MQLHCKDRGIKYLKQNINARAMLLLSLTTLLFKAAKQKILRGIEGGNVVFGYTTYLFKAD